jgi:hypothetical protein
LETWAAQLSRLADVTDRQPGGLLFPLPDRGEREYLFIRALKIRRKSDIAQPQFNHQKH